MWCNRVRWSLLSLMFLSLTACVTTPPSGPRVIEVQPVSPCSMSSSAVFVPASDVSCRVVEGRWYYTTWIPEHRVCMYTNYPYKLVWVKGCCGHYVVKHHGVRAGRCMVR